MFLSKIYSDSLRRYSPTEGIYELHQKVWEFFGDQRSNRVRDFLYYLYNGELYIISKKKPNPPEDEYTTQTKVFDLNNLKSGIFLQYDLRLNAEVCKLKTRKKVSIMTDLANEMKVLDEPYNWNFIAHESSKNWLQKRGQSYGFKNMIQKHSVQSFQFCKFKKKDGKVVSFFSIDLRGVLQVVNKNLFVNTIYNGIGKSKGFGCGMMLIAPYKSY